MEKVDLIIGAVGIVALVVTGLGIAYYNDAQTDYNIAETSIAFSPIAATTVSGAGLEYDFDTPDNSVGATFDVTVAITGPQGTPPQGTVVVTLKMTGPDGSTADLTQSFAASAGSTTLTLTNAMPWAEIPGDFQGDSDDVEANTHTWAEPIRLEIDVDCGQGALPLPQFAPTCTAAVDGQALAYSISSDRPEPEAA